MAPAPIALPSNEEDQEYDQFVRELAFEKRAKPKDRRKTEEELALEEKETLEKAERKRLRRMQGLEEESDNENNGKKGKGRQRGGDDLEDDFMDEEGTWGGLGAGLDGGTLQNDGGHSESEDDEDDEEDERDTEGGSDAEDESVVASEHSESEEEDVGDAGESEELVKPSKVYKKTRNASHGTKELPFTFPCPSNHEEFLEIVENIEDSDIPIVVQRIRTLHHPSLAQDNKLKLQVEIFCPDHGYVY